MTLLRNDLRSEVTTRQGWFDNVLPRKAKLADPIDSAAPIRPDRAVPSPSNFEGWPPESSRADPDATDFPASPAIPPPRTVTAPLSSVQDAPSRLETRAGRTAPILEALTIAAFVGVASTALLEGMGPWKDALFLMTLAVLGTSILDAMQHRGLRGAASRGFALFGGVYLLIAFGPSVPLLHPSPLPTSRIIREIHFRAVEASNTPSPTPIRAGDLEQFLVVGQCSAAILAALMGSAIARRSYLMTRGE